MRKLDPINLILFPFGNIYEPSRQFGYTQQIIGYVCILICIEDVLRKTVCHKEMNGKGTQRFVCVMKKWKS